MGIWYTPPIYRSEHLWFATSFARHDQGDPVPTASEAIGSMCTTLAKASAQEIFALRKDDDAQLAGLTVEADAPAQRLSALDYCAQWAEQHTAAILSNVVVEPVAA
jgi:hypothetical protein